MLLAKRPVDILILLLWLPLPVQVVIVQGKSVPTKVQQNGTSTGRPWLKRVTDPRAPGCWNRPWICNQGEYPPRIRRLCCKNRCVDVKSDVDNCGLCGVRCPFTWQCCRGFCINTNTNPFHCGRCEHKCLFRSFCFYGICGYAAPLPPRPPYPYPYPFPPRPPKPELPFPPHPPYDPFPPHGQTVEGAPARWSASTPV